MSDSGDLEQDAERLRQARDDFWENANCMWCTPPPGSPPGTHTADCKRHVGITDGPSRRDVAARREVTVVTDERRAGFAESVIAGAATSTARIASRPPTPYDDDYDYAECLTCGVEWAWGAPREKLALFVADHNRRNH